MWLGLTLFDPPGKAERVCRTPTIRGARLGDKVRSARCSTLALGRSNALVPTPAVANIGNPLVYPFAINCSEIEFALTALTTFHLPILQSLPSTVYGVPRAEDLF